MTILSQVKIQLCQFAFFIFFSNPANPSERVLTVSGPIPPAHAVIHRQRRTLSQNLLIVQKPVNFGHCPVNVRRCLVNDRRCRVNVWQKTGVSVAVFPT